jgi:hypothetical protein
MPLPNLDEELALSRMITNDTYDDFIEAYRSFDIDPVLIERLQQIHNRANEYYISLLKLKF